MCVYLVCFTLLAWQFPALIPRVLLIIACEWLIHTLHCSPTLTFLIIHCAASMTTGMPLSELPSSSQVCHIRASCVPLHSWLVVACLYTLSAFDVPLSERSFSSQGVTCRLLLHSWLALSCSCVWSLSCCTVVTRLTLFVSLS